MALPSRTLCAYVRLCRAWLWCLLCGVVVVSCCTSTPPRSCQEHRQLGQTADGVYTIYLGGGGSATQVFCDMQTDGGGWTYVARGSTEQNGAYGSVQTDPNVAAEWSLGTAAIMQLRSSSVSPLEFL